METTFEGYKEVNGTFYRTETSDEIVDILEKLRANQTRVIFEWGNIKTGQGWGDEYGVTGRVSRSTGPCKIPLLINNTSSHGGGAILTDCIVSIVESKGKKVIYQHLNYKTGKRI